MAEKSTFIKLDRNISKWRWYQNANTFRVFVHLLLKANIENHEFEQTIVNRGELATSYNSIANDLKLTVKEVRVAINHLKRTGEVAVRIYPKYQVISVLEYDTYQSKGQANGHSEGTQRALKGQQLKNDKNAKEIKNISAPAEEIDTLKNRTF